MALIWPQDGMGWLRGIVIVALARTVMLGLEEVAGARGRDGASGGEKRGEEGGGRHGYAVMESKARRRWSVASSRQQRKLGYNGDGVVAKLRGKREKHSVERGAAMEMVVKLKAEDHWWHCKQTAKCGDRR